MANGAVGFGDIDLVARFGEERDGYGGPRGQGNRDLPGRVIVSRAAADRFLLTGAGANLKFAPPLGGTGDVQLVTVEEGHFAGGRRVRDRLLNGDEAAFGLILPPAGRSLMVTGQPNPAR